MVAGHKGHPDAVKKQGRKGRRNRLKGARGRGTLAKEKLPIFGMIQRGGEVVIQMLENVKQQMPNVLAFFDYANGKVHAECHADHKTDTFLAIFKRHVSSCPANRSIM